MVQNYNNWYIMVQNYNNWYIKVTNHKWLRISSLCTFLVSMLTMVGTVLPMWVRLDNNDESLGIGLFSWTKSVPDNDNSGVKIEDRLTRDAAYWKAMAAFAVISCVCSCVLVFLLLFYRISVIKGKHVDKFYAAVFTISVSTWLSNLVVMVVFMIYHSDAFTTASHSFPWCFVILLFALFLAVIVSLIVRFKLNPTDFYAYRAPLNFPNTRIDNRMFDDPYSPRYPRDDISLPGDNYDPRGMTRAPGDIADVRGPRPYLPPDYNKDRRPSRAASSIRDGGRQYLPDQRSIVLSPSNLRIGGNDPTFDPSYLHRPASELNRGY